MKQKIKRFFGLLGCYFIGIFSAVGIPFLVAFKEKEMRFSDYVVGVVGWCVILITYFYQKNTKPERKGR